MYNNWNPYGYETTSFRPTTSDDPTPRGAGQAQPVYRNPYTTWAQGGTPQAQQPQGQQPQAQQPQAQAPRPAPPPPQAEAPIDPSKGAIGAYIARLMANPDPYGEESYQRAYKQGVRNIDDSYRSQKTGVDEEMARLGIHDSTIAGGRLHDLNIGRRSAAVELQDRLAQNRARDYMGNAMGVGNLALGWGNQGLNQWNSNNNFLIALLSALGRLRLPR